MCSSDCGKMSPNRPNFSLRPESVVDRSDGVDLSLGSRRQLDGIGKGQNAFPIPGTSGVKRLVR